MRSLMAWAHHGRVHDALTALLMAVIKHSDQSDFRKEELLLAHSLKVWAIPVEKGWGQECGQ